MLQTSVDVTGGGPFALVVTFLLAVLFYAVTLHLAATFFIGDVPTQYAVRVAFAPAIVSFALQQWGPAVTLVATLSVDFAAVRWSYDIAWRPAVVVTLLHLAFFVALFIPLNNIFGFV